MIDNIMKGSCFEDINKTPEDELEIDNVCDYIRNLLLKIKRHLEKKPLVNSNYKMFISKDEGSELEELISNNKAIEKQVKHFNQECEKSLETLMKEKVESLSEGF